MVFVESYGRVARRGLVLAPGVGARARRRHPAPGRAGYSRAQRLPHLADVRRRSAGSRTRRCSPGCGWTASSATTTWSPAHRVHAQPAVRPGRLADGQRRPGQHPATGRRGAFYGYDHVLRLPQRRLPRARASATRRCPTSTPSRRSSRLELAPRAPATGDGRDRPGHQPRAVVAHPRTWCRPGPVGDGSVFDGMPRRRCRPRPTSGARRGRVRAAYAQSIAVLAAVAGLLPRARTPTTTSCWCCSGDHQPATIVSGLTAPATTCRSRVIAQRPAPSLAGISGWGWQPGLRPSPDAPVWRMDAFRDRFLRAYGRERHTGRLGRPR